MNSIRPAFLRTVALGLLAALAFGMPAAAQVVVNEIDYDQPGTDAAEFVELKNTGAAPVDLSLYSLRFVNGGVTPPAPYQTFALPAVSLAAGDYFVLCANAANTQNCDLDVTPNTDLIQNGAPDAVALILNSDLSIVDTVSYEGSTPGYTEGIGLALGDDNTTVARGIARFPDGADSNDNNADFSLRCITPGTQNLSASTGCAVGSATAEIYEIQGNGMSSPLRNLSVTTRDNVVTALDANGFFIQTPDARADADPQTSNGVFVFTAGAPAVAVGDVVDVTGTVDEFFEQTEMENPTVTIRSSGAALPLAVKLDAHTPSPDRPQPVTEMERLEGMRVEVPWGTVSAPSDPFGDAAIVARPGRAFREPGIAWPGVPGLPVWDGNPEVFEIDPNGLLLRDRLLNAGSRIVAGGVIGFAFGDYQLLPTSLRVTPRALPMPVRDRQGRELTVATQNLHQFVDTIDDPGTDEVVVNPVQYATKLTKLSRHIREVLKAPDVLIVQEAEKLAVLQDLAERIAQDDASVRYQPYLMEGDDIGGIDIGVMVRDRVVVNSVEQFGKGDTFVYQGQTFLLHDRPPLVVRAYVPGPDRPFFPLTIIGIHNRSLSGIDGPDGGRIREKRHQQALRTSRFIQTLQTETPGLHLVVAGDFNAYQFTDGYVDVLGQMTGRPDPAGAMIPATDEIEPDLDNQVLALPAIERYSFVFDGSAQALDHLLTSQALSARVTAVQFGRGNADAPRAWEEQPSTTLRTSDHDGLVVHIDPREAQEELRPPQ